MAKKYTCSYVDILNNDWTVDIYSDSFGGSATNITLGRSPCILDSESNTDDVDAQILGWKCRISILNTTQGEFNEFFTTDRTEYSCVVLRENVLLFFGYISPENYIDGYSGSLYFTEVEFVDATYQLKGKEFTLTGVNTVLDTLQHALNKAQSITLFENIDVYEDNQASAASSDSMLDHTYVHSNAFKDMDCEEVVIEIMKRFCATLWFYNSRWYVCRIGLLAASSDTFREWNSGGAYQGTSIISLSNNTTGGDNAFASMNALTSGGQVDFKPGIRNLIINQDYLRIQDDNEMINLPNPLAYSGSWPSPWERTGVVGSEDVGSARQMYGGEVCLILNVGGTFNINNGMKWEKYITGNADQDFQLEIDIRARKFTTTGSVLTFYYTLKWDDGTNVYYLQSGGNWTTTVNTNTTSTSGLSGTTGEITGLEESIPINSLPNTNTGLLSIIINGCHLDTADAAVAYIKSISMSIIGDNFPSANELILDVTCDPNNLRDKELKYVTGDIIDVENVNLFYEGGFYLNSNQTSRTGIWDLQGETEEESLNIVIGEEFALLFKIHRKLISTVLVSSLFLHYKTLRDDAGTYYRCIQSSFDTKRASIDVDYVELNTT